MSNIIPFNVLNSNEDGFAVLIGNQLPPHIEMIHAVKNGCEIHYHIESKSWIAETNIRGKKHFFPLVFSKKEAMEFGIGKDVSNYRNIFTKINIVKDADSPFPHLPKRIKGYVVVGGNYIGKEVA
jgi:hypothetical protein